MFFCSPVFFCTVTILATSQEVANCFIKIFHTFMVWIQVKMSPIETKVSQGLLPTAFYTCSADSDHMEQSLHWPCFTFSLLGSCPMLNAHRAQLPHHWNFSPALPVHQLRWGKAELCILRYSTKQMSTCYALPNNLISTDSMWPLPLSVSIPARKNHHSPSPQFLPLPHSIINIPMSTLALQMGSTKNKQSGEV